METLLQAAKVWHEAGLLVTTDTGLWKLCQCCHTMVSVSVTSPGDPLTPMQDWSSMWTSVLPSFMPMLEVGLPPDLMLNYLCAHISDWISFPNCSVKCPSLQNLLFQPALPWLELQSSRAQGEICCVSFILAFAWNENQVGGSCLFCVLFKWEVSSGCTHTQIFPCWEHFFGKSK